MKLTDGHAHLSENEQFYRTDIPFGITPVCICAANISDWESIKKMSDKYSNIRPFYGTHPWYLDSYPNIDELKRFLITNRSAGIGEIGLDSLHGKIEDQIAPFEQQLDLAESMNRPVTIHCVKAEETLLRILRKKDVTSILHSFSGPISYVKPFTECDCYFSLSPRILRKKNVRIIELLDAIPLDRLLLETDFPNNDISLSELYTQIAQIMDLPVSELTEITDHNLSHIAP